MKLGVIGLGSMGKRRVRDLLKLGCHVAGFDIRADRRRECHKMFGVEAVASFEKLRSLGPEAFVISTPPDKHFEYYARSYSNRVPFFSEANIFTPRPEWFTAQSKKYGVQGYPSATWCFHPPFQFLKKRLSRMLKDVNSVHYHYAGFLPFWHPGENYWNFYAGQRKTSAAREMVPFEMEALCWVFGRVHRVCAAHGQARRWKTDMDDHYHLLLEFENGIRGSLLVELHQPAPFRVAHISCRNSSYQFDGAQHLVKEHNVKDGTWRNIHPPSQRVLGSFDFEEVYLAEMTHFLEALTNKTKFLKTWEEDRHLSNILYAAELSQKMQRWIDVSDVDRMYSGTAWK